MSGVVTATVAVVAIAAAATEITAAVAIGAVTLSAVFATVAAVGAVMATVGALTHDKTLQTVGMVVGAVGGVGSLATSAGMFGASPTIEGLFGSGAAADGIMPASLDTSLNNPFTAEGIARAGSPTQSVPDVGAAVGAPVAEAQPVTVDGIATQGGFESAAHQEYMAPGSTGVMGGGDVPTVTESNVNPLATTTAAPSPAASTTAAGQTTAGTPTAPVVEPLTPPTTVAPPTPQAPGTFAGIGAPPSGTVTGATGFGTSMGPMNMGAGGGAGGAISDVFDFMKKNPTLTTGTLQAASSFFAGAFGAGTPSPSQQQLDAWQAQADQNTAAANLAKWQLSNMQGGVPAASGGGRISVTPGTGMINRPSAVTGVPA